MLRIPGRCLDRIDWGHSKFLLITIYARPRNRCKVSDTSSNYYFETHKLITVQPTRLSLLLILAVLAQKMRRFCKSGGKMRWIEVHHTPPDDTPEKTTHTRLMQAKGEFREHFSKHFCNPGSRSVTLQMRFPKTISLQQQRDMECEVTNMEIKKAVWDYGTDKAPGPDGFSFGFYRRFWNLIEIDVCDAVRYFFIHGEISNGCNLTFIALIPKIPDAKRSSYSHLKSLRFEDDKM
ncbi:hypothetical protein Tco_1437321 [Tanacetum coccineum]